MLRTTPGNTQQDDALKILGFKKNTWNSRTHTPVTDQEWGDIQEMNSKGTEQKHDSRRPKDEDELREIQEAEEQGKYSDLAVSAGNADRYVHSMFDYVRELCRLSVISWTCTAT